MKSLADQIADGDAQAEGDLGVLQQLASTMVHFELGFEILLGTKGPSPDEELNDFEVGSIELSGILSDIHYLSSKANLSICWTASARYARETTVG